MAQVDASTPFENAQPQKFLWVAKGAAAGGDGSADKPFATIQAAVNAATPGTAVMVRAGSYVENVKFPSNGGGTVDKPIWLLSADGPQAAKIAPADANNSTIKGLGVDNVVIKGFEINGGLNGIQFSQSGSNFTNLVDRIVIQDNVINNVKQDGIKISQADHVYILDNVIKGAGDQGVDFVAVNDSVIARNDVSGITGAAAIFAKGGSTDVLIANNYVHGVTKDGIIIGGWTEDQFFRPGYDSYEAKNVTVDGNKVEAVGMRPLNVLGAVDSNATNNYFEANPNYFTVVTVGAGNPKASEVAYSSNIDITDNVISRAKSQLSIEKGGNTDVTFQDNKVGTEASWTGKAGPAEPVKAEPVADVIAKAQAAPIVELVEPAVAPAVSHVWAETGAYQRTIFAYGGNNELYGSALNEHIDAGSGSDIMAGGRGDDTYVLSSKLDKVIEAAGEGVDTAIVYDKIHFLADNVENLKGNAANNDQLLIGNTLENIIVGSVGNDTIAGGAGSDKMTGGAGADTFIVDRGEGQDLVTDFAAGSDKIIFKGGLFQTFDDIRAAATQTGSDLVIDLGGGNSVTIQNVTLETLTASDFDMGAVVTTASKATMWNKSFNGAMQRDHLIGTDGADAFDGKANGDVFVGGKGDDWYTVKTEADTVIEHAGEGIDTVYLRTASYHLTNHVENVDTKLNTGVQIWGNASANSIAGGTGNDKIWGGLGADSLTGRAGADLFVYTNVAEGGDRITDFQRGVDKLDLHDVLADHAGSSVSFRGTASGLEVYIDHGGAHDLLATLQGVTGNGLTAGIDYVV